jgi:hypothetical protein
MFNGSSEKKLLYNSNVQRTYSWQAFSHLLSMQEKIWGSAASYAEVPPLNDKLAI